MRLLRALLPRDELLADSFVALLHDIEFLVAQGFDIHHLVSSGVGGANEFIQLQIDRTSIAILGVLDEEDHEEGDDGRPRVDDKLPSVGEAKERPGGGPAYDDKDCPHKGPFRAEPSGCRRGKSSEGISLGFGRDLRRNPFHGALTEVGNRGVFGHAGLIVERWRAEAYDSACSRRE